MNREREHQKLAFVLGNYVKWVLFKAQKHGIERLYFLSRDGYLLWKMGQILCRRFKIAIECRYLCCSRYSLNLPAFCLNEISGMDYLCRGGTDVTLSKILDRSGLKEQEKKEVLDKLDASNWCDEKLSKEKLIKVRSQLETCSLFLEFVRRHSKKALQSISGYLMQEGLLETVSFAIVDSGWSGTTQDTLNRLLEYMGRKEHLKGYYFGLYELPSNTKRAAYHSYYFSPETHLFRKVFFSNCFFEAVYTAPHGTTIGYQNIGGIYQPLFAKDRRKKQNVCKDISHACVRYASSCASLHLTNFQKEKRRTERILGKIMSAPSRQQAKYYGNISFSDDVNGEGEQVLARPMTDSQLNHYHFFPMLYRKVKKEKSWIPESAWYPGSAVLYGKHPAWHLYGYTLFQTARYFFKIQKEKRKRRKESSCSCHQKQNSMHS